MIKHYSQRKFILALITFSVSALGSSIPEDTKSSGPTLGLSLFKNFNKEQGIMLNFTGLNNDNIPDQRVYKLSFRNKLTSKLKLGLTYQRIYGQRHNEDWIINTTGDGWTWRETKNRGENIFYPFLQFKDRIDFWEGAAYKVRLAYRYNEFNDQQDIFLKGALINILSPQFTLNNQINFIIPTSYGVAFLRDFWTYTSLGFNLSRQWVVGMDVSYWRQYWNESLFFKSRTGREFESTNSAINYGLFLSLYL